VIITAADGIGLNQNGGNIRLVHGSRTGTGTQGSVAISAVSGVSVLRGFTTDLHVGNIPGATATTGIITIQRVPAVIVVTGSTLINGSIQQVNTTGGAIAAINFPNPNVSAGQTIDLVMVGVGNNFTLVTPAGSINGGGLSVAVTPAAFEQFTCKCNGTNWYVVRYTAI
jgi:hypothetical protein